MLQQNRILHQNGQWLVAIIVMAVGFSTAYYMYSLDKYSLIYFGDAASHTVAARKLFDWVDPGLQQIGTVWLPMPHLMLFFPSLVDQLFFGGFAGMVVGLPCLAITSMLLYKMARLQIEESLGYIALVIALLYATNPNIMYLGLTAMTEAPFMLFFVASVYFLHKWNRFPEGRRSLLYSAIFVALSTLCRYEGWIVPVFLIPYVVIFASRRYTERRKKIHVILLSLLCLSGIIFWIGYNAYRYGDALEFANAKYYSAASQALDRSNREMLFLQPLNVLSIYAITALAMYWPLLLVAATSGYFLYRRSSWKNMNIMLVFSALPPLFTIISMLVGIGEMNYWFNSRFLILFSPLLLMLTAISLTYMHKRTKMRKEVLGVTIFGLFISYSLIPFVGVVTLLDAAGGFFYKSNPYAVKTAETLRTAYDNGRIMIITGSAQEHRIMITSAIPLKEYDEGTEFTMWKDSFKQPWQYDKWLIMSKVPDSDAVTAVQYWTKGDINRLNQYYQIVYENEYYQLMVLR